MLSDFEPLSVRRWCISGGWGSGVFVYVCVCVMVRHMCAVSTWVGYSGELSG